MFDHFEILAPIYDRALGQPDHRILERLLRLPVEGRLLDVGGGTGRVASSLRRLTEQLVVTDLSANMLAEAAVKGRLNPVLAHAETLPFPSEVFDRVLIVDALHHFCDQRQSLGEVLRVLKPGGWLVIEEPNLHKGIVKVVAILEKVAFMRSHFYTPEAIQSMIASHGFTAAIEDGDRFRAWIIVEKTA